MAIRGRKVKIALSIVAVVLLLCGAALVWGFVIEPNRLVVRHEEIKLANLPAAFDGLKIVAISDLHGGSKYIDEAKIAHVASLVNATEPDLIFLLGDFVAQDENERLLMEPDAIARQLQSLRARYGVYAVLGNHDWWFDGRRVSAALTNAGITVLENDVKPISKDGQTIWLLGIPDFWTRQPIDLKPALQKINSPGPIIALTHNPDVFPTLPAEINLTVAGHTHGGQVRLPLIGRPIVPSKYGEKYAIGKVVENGRQLFVTPGIGTTGIAVRFFVPPEISVLTIRKE